MNKKRILKHYGVEERGFYRDDVFDMMTKDIRDSVLENDMVVLAGEWGSGKTTVFGEVKRLLSKDPDDAPIVVRVANEDRRGMCISHILTAILLDDRINQNEPHRRDMEARSRQVVRMLGVKHVSEKKRIALVIENAHELHVNTIRALKNFRENDFCGVSPLFAIVLIGQPELTDKINRFGEVRCRVTKYELNEASGWMTFDKRRRFLDVRYGKALTAEARRHVAILCRSPLAMEFMVEEAMQRYFLAGKKQLDEFCFEMAPMEYYNVLNDAIGKVSMKDISDKSGLSKTAVHNVLHDLDKNQQNKSAVLDALKDIEEKRLFSDESKKNKREFKMAAAGEG